jgi:hypothetical protein
MFTASFSTHQGIIREITGNSFSALFRHDVNPSSNSGIETSRLAGALLISQTYHRIDLRSSPRLCVAPGSSECDFTSAERQARFVVVSTGTV